MKCEALPETCFIDVHEQLFCQVNIGTINVCYWSQTTVFNVTRSYYLDLSAIKSF